jgi:hypothetical protein
MDRWHKVGPFLAVALEFGFTLICLFVAMAAPKPIGDLCYVLTQPGFAISDRLVSNPLGNIEEVWFVIFTVDTLIYSVPFGLFLWLLRRLLWKSD